MSQRWKEIAPGILFSSEDGISEIEIHGANLLEVGKTTNGVDIVVTQKQPLFIHILGNEDLKIQELTYSIDEKSKNFRNE